MALPITFTFTFSIRAALAEIDRLIRDAGQLPPLPRSWEEPLRQSVVVTSVQASTAIEGNPLTRDQVSRILRGARLAAKDRDVLEVKNYARAVKWIFEHQDSSANDITAVTILTLHDIVTRGIDESGPPGRYRTAQNSVVNRVTGERLFLPPPPEDVLPLMTELVERLQRDSETHFAVRSALAHLWLVAVHPFNDGNGRVARLLSNLILFRSAPHLGKITALEAYFFDNRERYWEAIARTLGPTYRSNVDVTSWVEYFLDGLRTRLKSELARWERTVTLVQTLAMIFHDDREVPTRARFGLFLALDSGSLSAGQYREAVGVSARTASNDLAKLVTKGWLVPIGKRRGRHYRPSEKLRQLERRTAP